LAAAAVAPAIVAPNDVESAPSCHVHALNSQEQVHQTPNRQSHSLSSPRIIHRAPQSTHKERLLRSALPGNGTDKLQSAPPQSMHLTTLSNVQAQLPPLHRALFNHGATYCDCDVILSRHTIVAAHAAVQEAHDETSIHLRWQYSQMLSILFCW
jgi:hypothetical protein